MPNEKSREEQENEQFETPLVKCGGCDAVIILYKGTLFKTCFCGDASPVVITQEGLNRGFSG